MSDYTKITNFTVKDTLPSGEAEKLVLGEELDDEFDAIQTAVNSKAELAEVSRSYVGGLIWDTTAQESAATVTPVLKYYPPGHAWRYGATGNGSNQTTVLQTWLNCGHKMLFLPDGDYLLTEGLEPQSGCTIYGEGPDTLIDMTSGVITDPHCFNVASKTNLIIRGMKLKPSNSGTRRSGFYVEDSTNVKFIDIDIKADDSVGAYFIDCDQCSAVRVRFEGADVGDAGQGYCVYFIGCKGCIALNCKALRPDFGFVSASNEVASLSGFGSTRTAEEAFGNMFVGCSVINADGHSFDLNSVTGHVISACTADDYLGVSDHTAFQVKHSSDDNCRNNVISGCTARNVGSGFGGQQGSNAIFVGCSVIGASLHGFTINSCNRFQFVGCTAREFAVTGIWIGSSSANNMYTGIILETSTLTAIGIHIVDSGGSNNFFDNIKLLTAGLASGITIASASAANNRFGRNVHLTDNTISDASTTTVWPYIVSTPVISTGATGTVNGPYVPRGMIVAVCRFLITTTITGSPQGQAGRLGDNDEIALTQALSGSAGAMVAMTQATQLLSSNAIMEARIGTAGSGGAGFFQFEGIPRL